MLLPFAHHRRPSNLWSVTWIEQIKSGGALNSELGAVIIEPITSGQIDGLSYIVLPYYEPMSENRLRRFLQRQYLRPQILRWLRQAANDTISKPGPDELRDLFLLPLEQIVSNTRMNSQIHKAAIIAIERLSTEQWRPYYVIAHNETFGKGIYFQI